MTSAGRFALSTNGSALPVIETLVNHTSGTRSGIAGIYNRWNYWPEAVEATAHDEKFLLTSASVSNLPHWEPTGCPQVETVGVATLQILECFNV